MNYYPLCMHYASPLEYVYGRYMIYFLSFSNVHNNWMGPPSKTGVVNHSAELAFPAAKRLEEIHILQLLDPLLLPDDDHGIAFEYLILRPDARDDPSIT